MELEDVEEVVVEVENSVFVEVEFVFLCEGCVDDFMGDGGREIDVGVGLNSGENSFVGLCDNCVLVLFICWEIVFSVDVL